MSDADIAAPLQGDMPILSWFSGRYARCFVALHPFLRIPGLDPAQCQFGPVILEASNVPCEIPFLDWVKTKSDEAHEDKLFDKEAVEQAARLHGEPISWAGICRASGIANHRDLNRGLLSSISALRAGYHSQSLAEQISSFCSRRKIFPPTTGEFQVLMASPLCALLVAHGESQYLIRDEFGFAEELVSLEYLRECGITPTGRLLKSYAPVWISSEDETLAISVEFDCFFTLIFGGDDPTFQKRVEELFEGFWCGEDTILNWWHTRPNP